MTKGPRQKESIRGTKEVFEQELFCVLNQDCQKIEHKPWSLVPDTKNASKFSVMQQSQSQHQYSQNSAYSE